MQEFESHTLCVTICREFIFKPKEHEPSHIHALYGEYMGEINILTGEMITGDLPAKALELVQEWLADHKNELQEMWENQYNIIFK